VNVLARWLRLLALRGVENVAALATERSVALLGVLSLALWAGIDRLRAGPDSSFNLFNIASLGLIVLMLLAFAFVMARGSRPPLLYRQSLFISTAALPVLIVVDAVIAHHLPDRWVRTFGGALAVYTLIYVWRALRAFTGARQPWAVFLCAVLVCGFFWIDRAAYLSTSLWVRRDPDRIMDATWRRASGESVLFSQQARIDTALGNVVSGDGSQPSVFFVGFAGMASQKVFAEEIKLASRVVASRFDTAQRELLLINDRRDRETYPLATVSGLRYALRGVAHKMNPQQDILFLSLSSHGSAAPLLAVSNGALSLEQVTDENLRQALTEAGIRWRIIVISACYAGAFIRGLEDANTILITAAAPDKTSFGCSDDRNLTYFGEAFYRDALPKARSLEEAFSLARTAIAGREVAEHITPSNPQAYFGADLVQVLSRHPMKEAGVPQN
jgi:hypothetical protein